jgi:hypothetical protein
MKRRGKQLVESWKQRALRKEKKTSWQPSKIWEFENYIIERLRSLGIVQ